MKWHRALLYAHLSSLLGYLCLQCRHPDLEADQRDMRRVSGSVANNNLLCLSSDLTCSGGGVISWAVTPMPSHQCIPTAWLVYSCH